MTADETKATPSRDHVGHLQVLRASGVHSYEMFLALKAQGVEPSDALRIMHGFMGDAKETVELADYILYTEEPFWLAEALESCLIHPISVECHSHRTIAHDWWRSHPRLSHLADGIPLQEPRPWGRCYSVSLGEADLRKIGAMRLIFPDGVSFHRCHLPVSFPDGSYGRNVHVILCPGLRSLEGLGIGLEFHTVRPPSSPLVAMRAPDLTLGDLPDLESLSSDISIYRQLTVFNCPNLRIGHSIRVLDRLFLWKLPWSQLPFELEPLADVELKDCPNMLPLGWAVHLRYLKISQVNWVAWPPELQVETLDIEDCPHLHLPNGFRLNGTLRLSGGLIETVPSGLVAGDELLIEKCSGRTMATDIQAHQLVLLNLPEIECLPVNLTAQKVVVANCPKLVIPDIWRSQVEWISEEEAENWTL